MSRPLLQLALDHTSLEAAQRDVALLQDHVDIVEAGTILCLTEGLRAVNALRAQCPEKIIVADWKVADAGETLAQQAFGAGAFAVGGNSDLRSEAFRFFNKLSSRAGVQTVRSGNSNFLLEHYISPTYRFSVVDLKFSLTAKL